MNLYQENLVELMGSRPDITLRNVKRDLNNYNAFLKDVETKLKELATISIQLKRINIKNKAAAEDNEVLFQYEITDNNKRIEDIEKLLFETEIEHLHKTPTQEKGEKPSNNGIKIKDRNSEENQLWLEVDLGSKITLYIRQGAYQIKTQIKAIKRLRDRPLKEHLPLLKLFESRRFQKLDTVDFDFENLLRSSDDWSVLTDDTRSGTDEQRTFVKKALATSDFALLEGPPGSGKTTSIIELIIQLSKQGKRILLCSSTHVAVDNVLKRVLTSYKEQCQDLVAPVRIAHDKRQIRYEEVEGYRLQELIKTKAREIKSHLQKEGSTQKLSESQSKLLESLKGNKYPKFFEEAILEASNLVCGTMIGILQHPQIKQSTIDVPFDVMIVDEASKVTFQEFLVPALYAKKWILVGDVQQLSPYVEGNYVEIALENLLDDEQKTHLETVFPIWKASQKHWQKHLKILLSNDFDNEAASKVFDKKLAVFNLDRDFKNPQNDALALNAADIVLAKNTKRNRDFLEKYVFVKADVYEGYLNGEFRKVQTYFDNKNFNHKKKERSTWQGELAHRLSQHYAFRDAPELGEHLQKDIDFLTPEGIVINEKYDTTLRDEVERIKRLTMPSILELLQKGLGKTIHKGRKLDRILYDGFPNSAKRLKFQSLSFQHRMNDLIAQTSRNQFYKGQLQTANTVIGSNFPYVEERTNPIATYKKDEQEVIWQTNAAKTRYDERKKQRLNANEEEANHIIEEVKEFLEWSKTAVPKPKAAPFEVAVLCFYREQEALMRRKLRKLFKEKTNHNYSPSKNFDFGRMKVILCTVDKFQGDEADMVLLSFAKASKNAFYKSPNRLNVALTRARYKLVVFGNHKFFKEKNVSDALTELAQFKVRKSSRRTSSNRPKKQFRNRYKKSKR